MLNVIAGFLFPIMVMGTDSAQSYYFFKNKAQNEAENVNLITAILQWRILWGIFVLTISFSLVKLFNTHFFDGELPWLYFAVPFLLSLLMSFISQATGLYRLRYLPIPFVGITFGQRLLGAAVGLLLVLNYKYDIFGILLGNLAAASLFIFIVWYLNRSFLDWSKIHFKWWPRLLKFGIPLLPEAFIWYILTATDRWFIIRYLSKDDLGIYAVGAKFSMLLMLAVVAFRQAWWPIALESLQTKEGPTLIRVFGRTYLAIGSVIIVILSAISPSLVKILATPSFYSAYLVIGLLAWQAVFYGFYLISSIGFWKREKMYFAPILMGTAAAINIAMDFYLVPKYGIVGAAAATGLSFIIWNLLAIIVSEILWPVRHSYFSLASITIVGVLASASITWGHFYDINPWKIWFISSASSLILIFLMMEINQWQTLIRSIIRKTFIKSKGN